MMRGIAGGVLLCVTLSLFGCTDSGTDPDLAPPVPATITAVAGTGQTGVVGTALPEPLVVVVRDAAGGVLSGVMVSWEVRSGGGSLDRSVVVTDDGGEARVMWELGELVDEQHEVRASVESLEPVTFTATAVAGRAAEVIVTPSSLDFDQLDATATLTATVRDRFGNLVEGIPVEWQSSNTSVAEVDGEGVVTSRGIGQADISALADTAVTLIPVVVDPGASVGLQIEGITPTVLTPGVEARIVGKGFSETVSENVVTIAGHAAAVLSATTTELVVTLPSRAVFGCMPVGQAEVAVTVGAAATQRLHQLAVARQIPELAVGEYLDLHADDPDRDCIELPAAGSGYLVSIYNTSTIHTASAPFRVRGAAGGVVAGAPVKLRATSSTPDFSVSARTRRGATVAGGRLQGRLTGPTPESRHAHMALLESNRELVRSFGRPARGSSPDPRIVTAAAPQPLTVGAMLDLRVPDITKHLCNDYIPVRARVVYAGPRAVVLEDSLAPLAGTMDAHYEALGREFEESMLPVLEENFGDPFALDTVLGNTGKILMLFSPAVNEFGGVAGFVMSGDFYPRTLCPSSDQAQIFYAIVPTGGSSSPNTPEDWHWTIRASVIHEVKHIVSFANRIARDAPALEESWLEESTARLAEELWGRKVFGNVYKGEAGYRSTIYCEIRPTWPECEGKPFIMLDHFHGVYEYLQAMSALSPLGWQDPNDWTFYGSGWLLVRWAIDHFAVNERDFIRALVNETELTGVRNLEARTGKSFAELLGPWSLSLYWDQPTAPLLSIPSWNVNDIFAGLRQDLPTIFGVQYPIVGSSTSFGAIDLADPTGVRGGSAKLVKITGAGSGTQLLELGGHPNGPAPGTVGIAILRIE